jgi:hypothetical protein
LRRLSENADFPYLFYPHNITLADTQSLEWHNFNHFK